MFVGTHFYECQSNVLCGSLPHSARNQGGSGKLISPSASANQTTFRSEGPMVSVIRPAYNVAPFIGEALDSVLAQTFTDYEIIVINDGSPDSEKLEHVLEPYWRGIIYLKQENRGAGAARNAGLKAARGKFVAFLDADD